ncbi:hypothetical protein JDV02_008035 [Purpureocillium takamizusanense]|uniref:Uncharacterized protein n=1 Tax=Purpureocillium takamizusanense TaxID=2060973 RepID=A0A9Q8VCX3_9HYPO|nr:uncharacterized protein JDV02_008035 [Purpureocillium takamizusanense]UNI22115.1 hypothetical protein JDV02_008035 [Purpureocillium takamizusanense]
MANVWLGNGVTIALWRTASADTSFLAGLFGSMLLYRAFFHRLRRFPGPFAARLSNFYHFAITARTNMQHHLFIRKLHGQYGDFVRTGPRELSIRRASAINLIYGPSSTCGKATWYDQNSDNPDHVSVENIRDLGKHRTRRKAWDNGLGFRGTFLLKYTIAFPMTDVADGGTAASPRRL